ncbi:GTP 3',8-cyclase MoaA [Clostridium butyricum]|uniref:GTP 3',8-cyclase MoaA n=1 Tax=Clostridium butyricum TaxID=1492 RepID=UPI0024B9A263|nr:GTP 3',8-cyclase MoaA [Clostridium butyricum]
MIDIYKRKIDYIRISITDRCNLRCVYCMPENGINLVKHDDILSYEEIIRLCRMFSKLGISKVKITGGEPLVRKDVYKLIKGIKEVEGIENVTLTTNGILLEGMIDDLVKSGLDAVNISIDTLKDDTYKSLTRVGDVNNVLNAINECLKYKDLKVKINCVPIKGKNEDELIDLLKLSKDNDISIRFIEMMPIGLGKNMNGLNDEEVKSLIEDNIGKLTAFNGKLGNGPSDYFTLEGYKGKIGFISAVNHKFCETCNRVRLTCEGFLKACLQYDIGTDLRKMLRSGKSDEEIMNAIEATIYNKPESHNFKLIKDDEEKIEHRAMSQIGG